MEYGQGGFLLRPTLDPPLGHFATNAWQDDIESAVTDKTCCLGFTESYYVTPGGSLPLEYVVETAHKFDLPVIVDAATQVPPVSRLSEYCNRGADITVFSGGKGLRGPNNTGLILAKGEKGVEIVEILLRFGFPYHSVGRHYKVSKEQVVGITRAVEIFVEEGDSWYDDQMEVAQFLKAELDKIPGLDVCIIPNDDTLFEHPRGVRVPRVKIEWDAAELGLTAAELDRDLAVDDPPIKIRGQMYGSHHTNKEVRTLDTYLLRADEPRIVASRIQKIMMK